MGTFLSLWQTSYEASPKGSSLLPESHQGQEMDAALARILGLAKLPMDDSGHPLQFEDLIENHLGQTQVVLSGSRNVSLGKDEYRYDFDEVNPDQATAIRQWAEAKAREAETETARQRKIAEVLHKHNLDDASVHAARQRVLTEAGLT